VRGRSPPRPLLTVPNVTAHPSTANVYQLRIIRCGTIIAFGVKRVKHLYATVFLSEKQLTSYELRHKIANFN